MGGIGLEPVTQLVEMTFLGTGFGDRFKVLRGDSRRFEEGVRRAEELAELQGKRASKRCSLAV
jgi:urease beta subunit